MRDGYSDLVSYVEHVAGDLPPAEISRFFASGMLLNVIASMGLEDLERAVGGAARQGDHAISRLFF